MYTVTMPGLDMKAPKYDAWFNMYDEAFENAERYSEKHGLLHSASAHNALVRREVAKLLKKFNVVENDWNKDYLVFESEEDYLAFILVYGYDSSVHN